MIFSGFLHLLAYISFSSLFGANNIPLHGYTPHFLYPFVWMYVFLSPRYIPMSGIAEFYADSSAFNFLGRAKFLRLWIL